MQYLIDTHIFIWFVENSSNLSQTAKNLIEDVNSEIFISIASLWEISIKTSIGKLKINGTFASIKNDLKANSIEILPINFEHMVENNQLPFYHRDPFDRILIAQAIVEKFNFISADAVFDDYLKGISLKRFF